MLVHAPPTIWLSLVLIYSVIKQKPDVVHVHISPGPGTPSLGKTWNSEFESVCVMLHWNFIFATPDSTFRFQNGRILCCQT